MVLSEFKLIERYFRQQGISRPDVILGVGDDAAVVAVPQNHELVLTMDTLVSGVHFPESCSAYDIAYKALAVNLSDLAAMGAQPAWATLSLSIPQLDEKWLDEFCRGLFALAQQYNVQLIGGDVTRGPLVLTLQLHGLVPKGGAIRRSGAKVDDLIYVTGQLGEAALGLMMEQGQIAIHDEALKALRNPQARIEEGIALRGIAHSMIDISDGLAADLGHILEESYCGAVIDEEAIPIASSLRHAMSYQEAWHKALFHGDDYELCFTVPASLQKKVDAIFSHFSCGAHLIGRIESEGGLRCRMRDKHIQSMETKGHQHF